MLWEMIVALDEMRVSLRIVCEDEATLVEAVLARLRLSLAPDFELTALGRAEADAKGRRDMPVMTMRVSRSGSDLGRSGQADRIVAHCDLLDALMVPNGTKAIAIALHAHWSASHRARFGEPASPSTVKRWRTEHARRGREGRSCPPPRRREKGPNRVVRGLRRHHAIRTNACGSGMKEGYRKAIAELRAVNAAAERFYGKPDMPLKPFSYGSFRRDCIDLRRGAVRR